jgi:O-antigen/teichoic acid export membrane protein
MIVILRLLSILGAVQSIASLNGVLYNSQGKAHIALKVTIIFNVLLIFAFSIGAYVGGILGLTLGYVFISIIATIPIFHYALKLINTRVIDLYNNLRSILLISAFMSITIYIISNQTFISTLPYLVQLLVLTMIGTVLYLGAMIVFNVKAYKEIKNEIMIRRKKVIKA